MKKLALTISLLAGATVGYSQGILNWSDYVPALNGKPAFSITIFSPGPGGVEQQLGNTSIDLPSGSATYAGTPLGSGSAGTTGPTGYSAGAHYEVGLYIDTASGNLAADVASGTPVAVDSFSAGSGGWDFSGGLDALTAYASGTAVYVELAAWYSGGGAASYAAAVTAGVPRGTGNVSTSTATVNGGTDNPLTPPGSLAGTGLQDFSLALPVPEPSTIVLGILGASAFLMRLRRK